MRLKRCLIMALLFFPLIVISQTKEETIEWLNHKLLEHTELIMGEYQLSIEKAENQEIIYVTQKIDFGAGPVPFYYYFFPKDISDVYTTIAYRTDRKLGIRIVSKNKRILKGDKLVDLQT